jgi:hypothetical protein
MQNSRLRTTCVTAYRKLPRLKVSVSGIELSHNGYGGRSLEATTHSLTIHAKKHDSIFISTSPVSLLTNDHTC